jgi:hypothetical protein
MLDGFTRALLIDTGVDDEKALERKASAIAAEFDWNLERTEGSLTGLQRTLQRAIDLHRKK